MFRGKIDTKEHIYDAGTFNFLGCYLYDQDNNFMALKIEMSPMHGTVASIDTHVINCCIF